MTKRPISLDEVWAGTDKEPGLEQSIERIFAHDFEKNAYMYTYTKIFNYCTSTRSAISAIGRSSRVTSRTNRRPTGENGVNTANDMFIGGDLYKKLRSVIDDKVTCVYNKAKKVNGVDILTDYHKNWKDYKFSIRVLNGVAQYLNKHWVQREKEEHGGPDSAVHDVHSMGIVAWRQNMYMKNLEPMMDQIMRVIQKERENEADNSHHLLLKTILQESVCELGLQKNGDKGQNGRPERDLAVYRETFETRFLKETTQYYQAESSSFIESHSLVDYLVKIEKRFEEEERRVRSYLDSSTGSKVEHTLVKVLIEAHIARIHDEFKPMVEHEKIGDLKRVFALVNRADKFRSEADKSNNVSPFLDPMRDAFRDHVIAEGIAAVDAIKETALAEPKSYIDAVLTVYKKYAKVVLDAFENDSGFSTQLDRAASKFVNRNAVCETRSSRSAELLARYSDSILKKNAKVASDDSDKEAAMSEVITIFKFIDEKDVFMEFYSKLFGNRLVKEISASEDNEETMIKKLKEECGHEYTSRLQKMFKDVVVSRTHTEEFKNKTRNNNTLKVDFSIKVLTTGHWNYKPSNPFILPVEIKACQDQFLQHYSQKHSGRKLTWIFAHSRCEVKFFPKAEAANFFIFTTTTHQLSILSIFNQKSSYSVDEIRSLTEIETENDYLYKIIAQLLKTKVLTSSATGSELPSGSDQISVNEAYKSKKKKMNISQPIKQETKTESDLTVKRVEEDRGLATQAAIVRIMKMRQRLNHNNLITAVVEQLQARFTAKVPLIKKQIEILVEKEYIARVDGERDMYEYLA